MRAQYLIPSTILGLSLFAAAAFGDTGLPPKSVFDQWELDFRVTPSLVEEFEDQTITIRSLNPTARCCIRCGPKHPKTGERQCLEQCGVVCSTHLR